MTDNVKHYLDMVAAGLAAGSVVLDHIVTITAGLMSIAWYTYRFIQARKDKRGNQ